MLKGLEGLFLAFPFRRQCSLFEVGPFLFCYGEYDFYMHEERMVTNVDLAYTHLQ